MRALILVALALLLTFLGGCRKKTPAEQLAEAEQLMQERQNALAVVKLQNLVEKHPEDPNAVDARLMLAQYYMTLNQPEQALKHLKDASNYAGVGTDRGDQAIGGQVVILANTGRFDEALEILNKTIETASKMPDPAISRRMEGIRAELQITFGETTETMAIGLRYYRDTMLNDSDPGQRGQARERLADYYRRMGRFDVSNEIYSEYITRYQDDPTTPHLVLAQAINHRMLGEEERGDELFEEGEALMLAGVEQELNRDSRAARLSDLSQYNIRMGRLEAAENYLRRIMSENQGRLPALEAQFAIAQLWLEALEFEKGIGILEQIKRENAGTMIEQQADQFLMQARAAEIGYQQYLEQMEKQKEAEAAGAPAGS